MRPVIAFALLFGLSTTTLAQSLRFENEPGKPIDVEATDGIEWQQDNKLFIARGSAKATQGDVVVEADQLIAHYRDTATGGTDVYRVDALGNVRMTSDQETATGDAAVYEFDRAVLVLEGNPVRLETDDSAVTASESLTYWDQERVAVARGRATATNEGRTITADVLTAFFEDDGTGAQGGDLSLLEAEGDVRIETETDIVQGERGVYNIKDGQATLLGNVNIVRDNNILQGARAEVDLDTGVSTLYSSLTGDEASLSPKGSRVRALIAPRPGADDN